MFIKKEIPFFFAYGIALTVKMCYNRTQKNTLISASGTKTGWLIAWSAALLYLYRMP